MSTYENMTVQQINAAILDYEDDIKLLRGTDKSGDISNVCLPAISSLRHELLKREHNYVHIGDFTIFRYDDTSVWIEAKGGEGGQFPIEALEAVLAAFYAEHF